MAKIDLHVHSKYSEHPSDWFLQRLGAKESYTEPEHIFLTAKNRGMDFVTITDHNRIEGAQLLQQKYPNEVLVGVESTTYFPENGCKIHLLLYGITEKQFEVVQQKRKNIYQLREYVKENNLAYSLAHATYSVNNKLTVEHLEKLLLLFDVFEGINGGRNFLFNNRWMEMLNQLTPAHIENLYSKYKIEPISDTPWHKSFTGGSDDHGGLFMGNTFTELDAQTPEEVLEKIKTKQTTARGNHNNFKHLAFTIYKVGFDFAKTKNIKTTHSFLYQISEKIFETQALRFRDKLKLYKLKSTNKKNGDKIGQLLVELIEEVKAIQFDNIEKRLDIVYKKVSAISDELLKKYLGLLQDDLSKGDIINLILNLSASLPSLFLSLPFLSTLRHMYVNKEIIKQVEKNLDIAIPKVEKKILWFTDTLNDLNGVSETLKELGWIAHRNNQNIKLVTSLLESETDGTLPPNVINLPVIFDFNLPYYEKLVLKFPSILKSIEILSQEEPTEIIISTPGPIGLIGMLVAKLLNVKVAGVYHTDFSKEIEKISEDNALKELVEDYTKWFYSMMDIIKVQTQEYINLLEERGFDRTKMQLISKGINTEFFAFQADGKTRVQQKYRMQDGINLLYTGRISRDKDLDFLMDIYKHIYSKRPDVNLLVVGDGPYYPALKEKMKSFDRIYFVGKIPRNELPEFYSASDVFVFPSTTDTFGMVVLEAQSCELPSVVSDMGGPQEILIDGKTGFIAKNSNLPDWINKIEKLIAIKESDEANYIQLKKYSRANVLNKFSWDKYFENILGQSN